MAAAEEGPLAARVVLVANRNDPDSLRIARHYAEVRGVPADNLITLPLSQAETVPWREFVDTLWEPLRAALVAQRWIDATISEARDAVGRRRFAPYGHRITALVVCRGVPLRIAADPQLLTEVPPLTKRAEFRTNAGSVDGELSLLAAPNHPITAYVPNPLFQNDRPTALQRGEVVKVSRLDGPTVADALALVDNAVLAERDGLLGRAYIDLANRDRNGDAMLEAAGRMLEAAGFETVVDRAPATMPPTAGGEAAAWYFGWYAADLDGPFAVPGFRFPPGAIALHIHSFSAATLRDPAHGWTGPLVARGVTATVGNVYEPYLMLTHRPDLLARALLRGDTLVDAAYYALPPLSWQAVLIGDPLYRPLAVPVAEQLRRLGQLPPELAGYALERWSQQTAAEGRWSDALAHWRTLLAGARMTPEMRRRWLPAAIRAAERAGDAARAAQWRGEK